MSTYVLEVDCSDLLPVRDVALSLLQDCGLHLSAIVPLANGKTMINHWCDQDQAMKAAARLTRAGFPSIARDCESR
jgi:hypothetical protein